MTYWCDQAGRAVRQDADCAYHRRVDRAEVGVQARHVECVEELLPKEERAAVPQESVACGGVLRRVVHVGPAYCCTHVDNQVLLYEADVSVLYSHVFDDRRAWAVGRGCSCRLARRYGARCGCRSVGRLARHRLARRRRGGCGRAYSRRTERGRASGRGRAGQALGVHARRFGGRRRTADLTSRASRRSCGCGCASIACQRVVAAAGRIARRGRVGRGVGGRVRRS